jgi:hypothetical protein
MFLGSHMLILASVTLSAIAGIGRDAPDSAADVGAESGPMADRHRFFARLLVEYEEHKCSVVPGIGPA